MIQPDKQSSALPVLAHRGYAARYPENTREGIAAAVAAGLPGKAATAVDGLPCAWVADLTAKYPLEQTLRGRGLWDALAIEASESVGAIAAVQRTTAAVGDDSAFDRISRARGGLLRLAAARHEIANQLATAAAAIQGASTPVGYVDTTFHVLTSAGLTRGTS